MGGKIVIVKKDRHANLDSFPFRYGFSEADDFNLLIQYDSKPFVQNIGSQQRLRVNHAKFTNPITGKTEEGNFVLVRDADDDQYTVITVIRTDNNIDKTLSEALKVFRKHEYVSVEDLIRYFHPLYIEGKIKTHHDLKKYLIELNSDNEEKVNEMELVLKDAYKEIDKLELDKKKLNTTIYDDYQDSESYARDEAIGKGWGDIYDEATKVAKVAFDNYLEEHENQIQKQIEAKGKIVMFFSHTVGEKNIREIYPKKSEDEIQRLIRGWKIFESVMNDSFIKNMEYLKKFPEKTFIEATEEVNIVIDLTAREIEDYKYWKDIIGDNFSIRTQELYRDKK
jgi:hypothetical protein